MRSPLLVGAAWVATVAIAFLIGGRLRPEASARGDQRPATDHRAEAPEAPSSRAPEARADSAAAPAPETPTKREPVKTVVVTPGMKPAELSAAIMEYADKKLAEGPEGQKELFREMDRLIQEMKTSFRDEQALMPLVYPWVKFLVQHEREVVGMMETLYKTAAEEPQWFEGLDDDSFEVICEGLALVLPGAVSEDQLARFRGHVEKLLALPKESLPQALQKNLRDIERNLEWWSPPMTVQQVLAMLNDPSVPATRKLTLLARAEPEALRGVDVTRIIADAVRGGQLNALWTIRNLPEGAVNTAALDPVVLDCAADGKLPSHQITIYLSATRRETWEAMRPFIQQGLARGGKATEAFAQSLLFFKDKTPQEFVRGVIATYALSYQIKLQLEATFGLATSR
jgi:hypothetical protein